MAADHGDPLKGHPRYRKIQDLSAGAFGFVQARQFWLCVCLSLSLARPPMRSDVDCNFVSQLAVDSKTGKNVRHCDGHCLLSPGTDRSKEHMLSGAPC